MGIVACNFGIIFVIEFLIIELQFLYYFIKRKRGIIFIDERHHFFALLGCKPVVFAIFDVVNKLQCTETFKLRVRQRARLLAAGLNFAILHQILIVGTDHWQLIFEPAIGQQAFLRAQGALPKKNALIAFELDGGCISLRLDGYIAGQIIFEIQLVPGGDLMNPVFAFINNQSILSKSLLEQCQAPLIPLIAKATIQFTGTLDPYPALV